jgi:uridine kinase
MHRAQLLNELASRIASVRRDHPVRVAIDGVDASGKTTLADELVAPLQRLGRTVIRSSVDRFHNPAVIRRRRGGLCPEGYFRDSFNYPALVRALLGPLGPGGTRRYRRAIFDFRSDSPVYAPIEEAVSDAVLLFDGVFLLRPELREHWDFSIFVSADFEITVKRAEERDLDLFGSVSNVRLRYEQRYVPGQRLYLSEVQPARWASIVINNNNPALPRIAHAV